MWGPDGRHVSNPHPETTQMTTRISKKDFAKGPDTKWHHARVGCVQSWGHNGKCGCRRCPTCDAPARLGSSYGDLLICCAREVGGVSCPSRIVKFVNGVMVA